MNSVILVYRFESVKSFKEEDKATGENPEYGKLAPEMHHGEGAVVYGLLREV